MKLSRRHGTTFGFSFLEIFLSSKTAGLKVA